ncbi:MAG: DUF11 domain-containing protein, partial [Candidatus Nanopelagicales bacterium]
PAQSGTATNTAAVSSGTPDPNPSNNTSMVSTAVTASADLSIAKSGPATVTAGGSMSYALVVVNKGPSDAGSVQVTDTLPAGVTFVSAIGLGWSCTNNGNVSVTCTLAALASAETADTITVVVSAPGQAMSLTNTASVASSTPDPNLANNTSSVTTGVSGSADLAIAKSGPATVLAGANVSYALVVVNNGPSDAAGVQVTDTLPAGVTFVSAAGTGWSCANNGNVSVTCTLAALASRVTADTITVVVTAPAQATTITNSASVASTTADPDPGNNTSSVSTVVTASADLSIVKSGPGTVTADGSVSYGLVVANAGPSDAVNVSVVDTLPAGVTFVSAAGVGWSCANNGNVSVTCTLAALASRVMADTITVVVTAPAHPSSLTNTAAVSSTTPDPNLANNTSSVTTGVSGSADLSITKSGPASVSAGGSVSYVLVVVNKGPSDAASVQVTDTLPAGVSFVSAVGSDWSCSNNGNGSVTCTRAVLAAGATAPTITVVVSAPAQATSLTNTASVSSTTPDPVPANNTSSVTTIVGASADLSITKSGPASVLPGSGAAYQLVVRNAGPSTASSVTVTDSLASGTTFVSATGPGWTCMNSGDISVRCTRAALASGATAPTITVVVQAPVRGATLTDTAVVSSAVKDPNPANNTATATTAVGAVANLALVKTGPATVVAGQAVTYHLVVANTGPDAATAVRVIDILPSGVRYVSASGSGWTCGHDGVISISCTRPTVASGSQAPVITVVLVAPTYPTSLRNSAVVGAGTYDPDTNNNSSAALTAVTASSSGGGSLPDTGAGLEIAPLGVVFLLLGGCLVWVTRRRLT